MSRVAIVDASVIVGLHQIECLALMPLLYRAILAPPAVIREASVRRTLPPWIERRGVADGVRLVQSDLGDGEIEAIQLALVIRPDAIFLDDLDARRVAIALGLPVSGTIGFLVEAKKRGVLDMIRSKLDALRDVNFFMSDGLYERALRLADEST